MDYKDNTYSNMVVLLKLCFINVFGHNRIFDYGPPTKLLLGLQRRMFESIKASHPTNTS